MSSLLIVNLLAMKGSFFLNGIFQQTSYVNTKFEPVQFSGEIILGPLDQYRGGLLDTQAGASRLMEVALYESSLFFCSRYILCGLEYVFTLKKEGDVWNGTFITRPIGNRGMVSCVLTPIPEKLVETIKKKYSKG
jgi:hypothetical protein